MDSTLGTGVSVRPKNRLTLLHCSDFHLEDEFQASAALSDFHKVMDIARALKVSGLLIAGDLFDSSRVSSQAVAQVFGTLGNLEVPVFILPGNHDTLLTAAQGKANGFLPLPPNVHLFREPAGETISAPLLGLSVWGKPVYDHNPSFRPLDGVGARVPNAWFVAIGHGLVTEGYYEGTYSSPISSEELRRADCDYIALGHVHAFREVTRGGPPAFYCGAPSASPNKTVALVTLDPHSGVSVEKLAVP